MNSDNSNDPSLNTWFNSIATPPPPEPKQPKLKRLFVIVGLILVASGLLYLLFVAVSPVVMTKACLDAEDYSTLTNTTLEGVLSPRENFYTKSVSFEQAKDSFAPATKDDTEQFIRKTADLYAEQANTSFTLTISSDYLSSDSKELSITRINTLKSMLLTAGIDAKAIVTTEPSQIVNAESDVSSLPSYIVITSASDCRE